MRSDARRVSWATLRDELRRRIAERHWTPGELLPTEAALAEEFSCARATVNRALQDLAATGLVERKRKAGTRVAATPILKATVAIPVIRREVEARGAVYAYRLAERRIAPPEGAMATAMATAVGLSEGARALRLVAHHFADGAGFAVEARWINLATVPGAEAEEFAEISPNEWLLQTQRYSHADVSLGARNASDSEAAFFGVAAGAAVFVVSRMTWSGEASITSAEIAYQPGYRLTTTV